MMRGKIEQMIGHVTRELCIIGRGQDEVSAGSQTGQSRSEKSAGIGHMLQNLKRAHGVIGAGIPCGMVLKGLAEDMNAGRAGLLHTGGIQFQSDIARKTLTKSAVAAPNL